MQNTIWTEAHLSDLELDYDDALSPEFALIEFHDAMGIPVNNSPTRLDRERLKRHYGLITEEVEELFESFDKRATANEVLKEFADVLYTVYSLAVEAGFWPYVEEAFYRVHESNMLKHPNPDGGKIQKGPDYRPPNFDDMNVHYPKQD